MLYQLVLNYLSFFPNTVFGNTILVGWFFVIKPGPSAEQPVSISFFGVALSPLEVLLMISLRSTDSLLHDVPGSESFNFEFVLYFPFPVKFWKNYIFDKKTLELATMSKTKSTLSHRRSTHHEENKAINFRMFLCVLDEKKRLTAQSIKSSIMWCPISITK